MKRTIATFAAAVAAAASLVALAPAAQADTETCVGRAEYDNMQFGLTVNQVYNRFDVYGYYLGDNEARFRRGYKTCWAPGERRVVVAFSYDTGGSVDWWIADVD